MFKYYLGKLRDSKGQSDKKKDKEGRQSDQIQIKDMEQKDQKQGGQRES